jgi:hypothetical protein
MNNSQKGINVLLFFFTLIKGIFFAVTQVAWGLVSLFGLNIILGYMINEGTTFYIDETFLMMESFIIENMLIFVFVFFILCVYTELKETGIIKYG